MNGERILIFDNNAVVEIFVVAKFATTRQTSSHLFSCIGARHCGITRTKVNSLAPGKFEWYFRYLIFQIISVIDGWVISCEFALRWMSLDLTDDKSPLVQVMAWCRQATSHYLSQWWPRYLLPYGITRPQWVDLWSVSLRFNDILLWAISQEIPQPSITKLAWKLLPGVNEWKTFFS